MSKVPHALFRKPFAASLHPFRVAEKMSVGLNARLCLAMTSPTLLFKNESSTQLFFISL